MMNEREAPKAADRVLAPIDSSPARPEELQLKQRTISGNIETVLGVRVCVQAARRMKAEFV